MQRWTALQRIGEIAFRIEPRQVVVRLPVKLHSWAI
jgi:hypothetical protein